MDQLVSAEDILAKMRAGTKETYDIKFRGYAFAVRMLSLDERLEIRLRMITENARTGGDETNLSSITQKEILRTATTLTGGVSSVPDRLFNLMTMDEILFLGKEYQTICEKVNPALETMDPDQFNFLVQAIKKNSISASDCSWLQLKTVFISYQDLIQQMEIQA